MHGWQEARELTPWPLISVICRTVETACPMLDAVMAVSGAVHAHAAPSAPCAPPPPPRADAALAYVNPVLSDVKRHLLGRQPGGEATGPVPTLLALCGPSGAQFGLRRVLLSYCAAAFFSSDVSELLHCTGSGKTTIAAQLLADSEIGRNFQDGIHWVRIRSDAPDRAEEVRRAQKDLLASLRHHNTAPDSKPGRQPGEPHYPIPEASRRRHPIDVIARGTALSVLWEYSCADHFAWRSAGQSPATDRGAAGVAAEVAPKMAQDASPLRSGGGADLLAAAAAAIFGRGAPEVAGRFGSRATDTGPSLGGEREVPSTSPRRARGQRHGDLASQSVSDGIAEEMTHRRVLVIVDECPDAHTLEIFTVLVRQRPLDTPSPAPHSHLWLCSAVRNPRFLDRLLDRRQS